MILRAPTGVSSCSVGGETYDVKKGVVKVPDELVSELFDHGFRKIEPKEPSEADIAAAEKALKEAQEQADKEAQEEADRLAAEEAAKGKMANEGTKPPEGE